jgi:hypothetical protein
MTTRVICDPNSVSGPRVITAVRLIIEARNKITEAAEALYSAIYTGNGADLEAVEGELGIQPGQGQQAFDLVQGARLVLDDPRIDALREMDQG